MPPGAGQERIPALPGSRIGEDPGDLVVQEVVRHLGIEPEWTVVTEDGVGFVSAELGVWLTVEDVGATSPFLRAEVRFGLSVPDREAGLFVLEGLNHRGSVGRWILDPATGTVSGMASLDLGAVLRDSAVQVAAEVVSSLVVRAEDLVSCSVPERDMGGRKALTLIDGRRRDREHAFFREYFERQLQAGEEPGAARRVLPLVQDGMLYLTLGWWADHGMAESWCTNGKGLGMAVKVAKHPALGYGLMIAAGLEEPVDRDPADVAGRAAHLNRFQTAAPGLGAWGDGLGGLEYRLFLPNSLIETIESDLPEPRLISSAVREVVERVEWWAAVAELDDPPGHLLAHPDWEGDDEAELLARRDPINDGLDAPASYAWIDGLGRAAATTEDSYRLWRSRLTPDDLDDPGVAGFSDWFEREVAHRHGRA